MSHLEQQISVIWAVGETNDLGLGLSLGPKKRFITAGHLSWVSAEYSRFEPFSSLTFISYKVDIWMFSDGVWETH